MTEKEVRILVANPQIDETDNLVEYFSALGYSATAATEVDKIQDILRGERFALTFIDSEFLEEIGEDIFEWSKYDSNNGHVVVMSSSPTVESVINVLRMGVFDCLIRPFDLQELSRLTVRVLERQGIRSKQTVCVNTCNCDSIIANVKEEAV